MEIHGKVQNRSSKSEADGLHEDGEVIRIPISIKVTKILEIPKNHCKMDEPKLRQTGANKDAASSKGTCGIPKG